MKKHRKCECCRVYKTGKMAKTMIALSIRGDESQKCLQKVYENASEGTGGRHTKVRLHVLTDISFSQRKGATRVIFVAIDQGR